MEVWREITHRADPLWEKGAGLFHPYVSPSVATPESTQGRGYNLFSQRQFCQGEVAVNYSQDTCWGWEMGVPAEKGYPVGHQQLLGLKSHVLFHYNFKGKLCANLEISTLCTFQNFDYLLPKFQIWNYIINSSGGETLPWLSFNFRHALQCAVNSVFPQWVKWNAVERCRIE